MNYWTIDEAAEALRVSRRTIERLINEADAEPKTSRWKFGKELVDLTPKNRERRIIRINQEALLA